MVGSIILLVILVMLNAIFAGAELAVVSMNDKKLKRMVEGGGFNHADTGIFQSGIW